MSEVTEWMDKWGPEKIIVVHDTRTGMKGMLVIDNTARGMGKGGCRIAPDVTLWDCFRLARTMTWKWAIADVFLGGAKAAIVADPKDPNKEEIVRAFVRAIRKFLPDEYVFGNDMGFSGKDEAIVIDECGGDARVAIGTPAALGGLPYDEMGLTGYGVAEVTGVAVEYCGLNLNEASIAIQGLGAVGSFTARYLSQKGAKIVAISSIEGALYDPNGLNIERLCKLKEECGDSAINEYAEAKVIPTGEEVKLGVDILIPAAGGDVISEENAGDVKAKLIVEGANFPITNGAERILDEKGVLIVPDIVANAGAAIGAGLAMHQRYSCCGIEQSEIYSTIRQKITSNVSLVLNEARKRNRSPRQVALEIAQERVLEAMKVKGRIPKPRS